MKENHIKSERIQMLISKPELEEIDDFRFAMRINSRAEAIRTLCKAALIAQRPEPAGTFDHKKIRDACIAEFAVELKDMTREKIVVELDSVTRTIDEETAWQEALSARLDQMDEEEAAKP